MPASIRKYFLPWTAEDCFDSEQQFQDWLQRRRRVFLDWRSILLFLAAACLLAGYFLDRRPIMLLTIVPLALVLLLTMAVGRTEAVLEEQAASASSEEE